MHPQRSAARPHRAFTLACTAVLAAPLVGQQSVTVQLSEASIAELQAAMQSGLLTAEGLAQRYLERIAAYNHAGPNLNGILLTNPDLLTEARQRDSDAQLHGIRGPLFGVPILLKDNIDALPMATSAGSVALANSVPPDDAFLVQRLRAAGAIVVGKATMTEFANFMSTGGMPNGYSSLGGYGCNPYDTTRSTTGQPTADTGGSSSGSGISVAANMVCVAIGTETSGSILSPSCQNGVVGIKPTVGLVSRDGILPITADQDTAGPIARTVADAAAVLGAIAGYDANDPATVPCLTPGNCFTDYTQFLNRSALMGARIAVPPFALSADQTQVMQAATGLLRAMGATVVDPYTMPALNMPPIAVTHGAPTNQSTVLIFGMKRDLNTYLASLGPNAPMQSLGAIITYNSTHNPPALRYGQAILTAANLYNTSLISADLTRYTSDRQRDLTLSRGWLDPVYAAGFDAILFPGPFGADTPARAGYPSIAVPGGFLNNGLPFDVTFSGPAFSEARLIAIAYAFEQASGHRAPPASAPALTTDQIPFQLANVHPFAAGCAGSNGMPTIATVGLPIIANNVFGIALGSLAPSAPALLAVSLTSTTTNYNGCFLFPSLPFLYLGLGTSDAAGSASFGLEIPWDPALSGSQVIIQGGAIDPGANAAGFSTTRGLQLTIGG